MSAPPQPSRTRLETSRMRAVISSTDRLLSVLLRTITSTGKKEIITSNNLS